MKLSTDFTRKEGQDQMSTTLTKNEDEEIEKAQTKVNKVTLNEYKAERLYQLKKFIKARLNIPEHFKGETL